MERLVDSVLYGRYGPPHDLWTQMRREAPVQWVEVPGYPPFWAVTGHAEVRAVSVAPETFSSRARIVMGPIGGPDTQQTALGTSEKFGSVISTDPPEHRRYRGLTLPYFKPRALKGLEGRIREITRTLLDRAPADIDFVTEFAAWHPLRVLCEILGVEDEKVLFSLTNDFVGAEDEEFTGSPAGIGGYLSALLADRRACPRDDLASLIAGSGLSDPESLMYLLILAVAGHDTTRSAIAGGMLALIDHPEQLELLRSDPSLYDRAAHEIVRWTSPVVHFLRKTVRDTELGGRHIAAGERIMLFYPSANRDESVFDAPFEFRVDRDPNPHLGWGVGEHYCLGANLARMEIRVLLEELVPRLGSARLTGTPEWMASNLTCGLKHLPLHWTLDRSS